MMRPTLVFNIHLLDLDGANEDAILATYNRIVKIVEEYYFYKSKIENWNVLIETNDINAFKLPI